MNRLLYSLPQSILSRSLPTFTLKSLHPFVINPINYKVSAQLLHTSKVFKYCSQSSSRSVVSPLEGQAKLVKDVIVFRYENPKFFKYLNIFAICQFLCWNYLAHFSFTSLKDAPVQNVEEDASWYRKINLGENKYRNTLTIMCFMIGKFLYSENPIPSLDKKKSFIRFQDTEYCLYHGCTFFVRCVF